MAKLTYEKPVVTDYGSIADHTFGDGLGNLFPAATPFAKPPPAPSI